MFLKYFFIITALSNVLYLEANAKAEIITGSRKIYSQNNITEVSIISYNPQIMKIVQNLQKICELIL